VAEAPIHSLLPIALIPPAPLWAIVGLRPPARYKKRCRTKRLSQPLSPGRAY